MLLTARIAIKSKNYCRIFAPFFQDESFHCVWKENVYFNFLSFVPHVQLNVQKTTGCFQYKKVNLSCGCVSFGLNSNIGKKIKQMYCFLGLGAKALPLWKHNIYNKSSGCVPPITIWYQLSSDHDDNDEDDNEFFWWYGRPRKGV